jgi:GNAT superfamily N-acetyltransferase
MWWRVTGREFSANGNAGNRERFREIVRDRAEPGLLAYAGETPVGWCAVCPRDELGRVLRSTALKPRDDRAGVWAISCFFVARARRGAGVARALLPAAVAFARDRGARHVEAYPVDGAAGIPDAEAYTGTLAMFLAKGFTVVEPRRPGRRVLVSRSCSAPTPARG